MGTSTQLDQLDLVEVSIADLLSDIEPVGCKEFSTHVGDPYNQLNTNQLIFAKLYNVGSGEEYSEDLLTISLRDGEEKDLVLHLCHVDDLRAIVKNVMTDHYSST